MPNPSLPEDFATNRMPRRRFLQLVQLSGLGTLLSGCSVGGLEAVIHQTWEPVNQTL